MSSTLLLSGCLLTEVFKEELIEESKVAKLQQKLDSIEEQITIQELARKIQDFEQLKPDLKRIVELESDLAYLTETMRAGDAAVLGVQSAFNALPSIGDQYSKQDIINQQLDTSASEPSFSQVAPAPTQFRNMSIEVGSATKVMSTDQFSDLRQDAAQVDAKFSSDMAATVNTSQLSGNSVDTSEVQEDKFQQPNPRLIVGSTIVANDQLSSCVQAGNNNADYSIHLASYSNETNARLGWQILGAKYEGLLCKLTPKLASVSVNGKEYFSLRVGPLDDTSTAIDLCKEIRKTGGYCASARFAGKNLLSL